MKKKGARKDQAVSSRKVVQATIVQEEEPAVIISKPRGGGGGRRAKLDVPEKVSNQVEAEIITQEPVAAAPLPKKRGGRRNAKEVAPVVEETEVASEEPKTNPVAKKRGRPGKKVKVVAEEDTHEESMDSASLDQAIQAEQVPVEVEKPVSKPVAKRGRKGKKQVQAAAEESIISESQADDRQEISEELLEVEPVEIAQVATIVEEPKYVSALAKKLKNHKKSNSIEYKSDVVESTKEATDGESTEMQLDLKVEEPKPKAKRGRKKKASPSAEITKPVSPAQDDVVMQVEVDAVSVQEKPKKRGRPAAKKASPVPPTESSLDEKENVAVAVSGGSAGVNVEKSQKDSDNNKIPLALSTMAKSLMDATQLTQEEVEGLYQSHQDMNVVDFLEMLAEVGIKKLDARFQEQIDALV